MDEFRRPPQAVLFCCTMNAIRSPMAEGLFKRRFGTRCFVDSAGLKKSEAPDPMMVEVMDELGIELKKHRPKTFDQLEDSSFDVIVSLSPEAHHRALEFARNNDIDVEYWPTFDPTYIDGTRDQRLEAYREVRNQLDRKLAQRFAVLRP
jgi:protein-tyrosine-phosphatase